MLNYCVIFMLILAFTAHKVSNQDTCREFGAVRLISRHDYLPNVGRVAVCDGSNWGTICCDSWDEDDAAVVCRELGYTANGARAFHYDFDENIVIKDVTCDSTEQRLRDCAYSNYTAMPDTCSRGGGAGVRCRAFKNVDVATVNIPYNTMPSVVVTWEYYQHNYTFPHPTFFRVRCSSEQHYMCTKLSVNNETFRISISGLIPFTSYNCCVSAIYYYYYGYYVRGTQCTSISSAALTEMVTSSDSNMRANIIGGVLGFIIVILVISLTICGGALLYSVLRSRVVIPKRSSQHLDNNSTEMPVGRNISYVTAPSTSGSQATDTVGQGGAAAEYSRIGPSYETTVNSRRQQPVAGRKQVSARLSERYEFSEAHLAMASGGGGGGGQGETSMEYEVPLQSGEHEEYSRLQH